MARTGRLGFSLAHGRNQEVILESFTSTGPVLGQRTVTSFTSFSVPDPKQSLPPSQQGARSSAERVTRMVYNLLWVTALFPVSLAHPFRPYIIHFNGFAVLEIFPSCNRKGRDSDVTTSLISIFFPYSNSSCL